MKWAKTAVNATIFISFIAVFDALLIAKVINKFSRRGDGAVVDPFLLIWQWRCSTAIEGL